MSLFQKSVEKKYLNEIESSLIDEKFGAFQSYFGNAEIQENIRNSKEEQFQEGFLRELFVKILDYTLNPEPDFNLTTELKNIANAKKADGAILKNDKAIAVIELKSASTTDLDSVEDQAFGYKNHHPKCVYVITSNFEKLRFYIQNAVEYIEFDLFNLSKESFALMWLCLSKDNILKDVPLRIKESSVLQEENVTKKLYADYSKFRESIFDNIVKNNSQIDKLLLFKKTQKLLDRFLFVFFAEDRLLLPPNSISEIVKQWTDLKDKYDEYFPLYNRFKKYFRYMNTGFKGKQYDIYPYNGGLFAPDEILDAISIDDEVLHKHTLKLSTYDFETEVDVNILGHIFEHSLSEIENVQAEIQGQEIDKQKSKRKKDGIFYTPKYITKYIVENTVGKLCSEKRKELEIIDEDFTPNRNKSTKRKLINKLDNYREWLLSLTILDPACGSGAFLNQALDFLVEEHHKIDALKTQLLGGGLIFSDIETDILEKNIYGVDLNEESVEIAKLSLWLRTARKGRKLNTLSNNIKCGNSLIDDPEIAGEKAFNWYKEFPNIFQEKAKKPFHITWVTHNSRVSKRMIEYKVIKGDAVWLQEEYEIVIAQTIKECIEQDNLNVMSYNSCGDHVHILLVCEEEEIPNIVRKLKGKSSQRLKEYLHVPKEEKFTLWAQKYSNTYIESEEQLWNTIEYIRNNRLKHNLPTSSSNDKAHSQGLQPLVASESPQRAEIGKDYSTSSKSKPGESTSSNKPSCNKPSCNKPSCNKGSSNNASCNKGSSNNASHNKGASNNTSYNTSYNNKGLQPLVVATTTTPTTTDDRQQSDMDMAINKGLQSLVNCDAMNQSYSHAFRTEYKGGFDVVIGNPPYVRSELLSPFRDYLEQNFTVYNPAGDLFSYFYEKSFELLKPETGLFGFISNTFDKTTAGISIRDYLQMEILFLKYVDFTEVQIFEGATTYPVIIIAQNRKGIDNSFSYTKIPKTSQASIIDIGLHSVVEVAQQSLAKENWSFKSHQSVRLMNKLGKQKTIRNIYGKCYYGVKTALNEAFIIPKTYPTGEHVKPIFEGKELAKWISPESIQQLILFESKWTRKIYGDDVTEDIALEKLKNDFPQLMNHILPLEERAKKRYDKGDFFWELRNCAYYDLFEKPKVVFPNLQNSNKFAYDETGAYINAPAVILPTEDRFLIVVLNSKLIWYFLTNICVVRSGGYIEVKPQYFEQIPIPEITDDQKIKLDELAKAAINSTKVCQEIQSKFIKLLMNKYTDIKISKKLEKWYDLNFNQFLKELKKQKIKLSLADESEWMDFFGEQVKAYSEKSQLIYEVEKEIDQMVYQVYALTEEEIQIVENSI